MKSHIPNNRDLIRKVIFLFLILGSSLTFAQVQQNGNLYISDNSVVTVKTIDYNFGTTATATTATTKTPITYGKLFFLAGADYDAETDTHQVNGYAGTTGKTEFTFPVGNGSSLAPIAISSAVVSSTYDAAYFFANPTAVSTIVDAATLYDISDVEYWNLESSSTALISLSWRSTSNLSTLATSLADVTIAGWNNTQWIAIASTVDTNDFSNATATASTLTAGSITTDANVDLSAFSYFTFGSKATPCAPLVSPSGITITWNGLNWSGGAPTLADAVVLNAPYTGGSFKCNSLQMNAFDITLSGTQNIEIVNDVTGTGEIIMATSTSVVQRNSTATSPMVRMTKTGIDAVRYDYMYLGTPIESTTGNINQYKASAYGAGGGLNALDRTYQWRSGAGGGWETIPGATTTNGKGFIARVAAAAPFSTATTQADISFLMTGQANNGNINVTDFSNEPADPTGVNSYAVVGNPYPSAIDAETFIRGNAGLTGAVYVWQTTTNPGQQRVYTQGDFLVFTLAGYTAPSGHGTFGGSIPSGQGFNVGILANIDGTTVENPTISFTNCMRITGDNDVFYKNGNQPVDRFKVNMTGANGVFSQILVGYYPEATIGYDRMYDARVNSASTAKLYSFDNAATELSINARPSFFRTDAVPVGISKNNTNLETFQFSIDQKEGVFNSSSVDVYLHDKILNTYHDLNSGNFIFTTSEQSIDDRFEIVYENSILSNSDVVAPVTTASLVNTAFNVASSERMENIQIFDLAGRLIQNYKSVNSTSFESSFNHAEGVYIATVSYENGLADSIKLIHIK